MAIGMDDLKKLVEGEELRYFLDPKRDAVMLGFAGINGRFQFVISLQLEGQFLQFRSLGYLNCPSEHPHLGAVLRCLAEINYRVRLVKFAWDPGDGEIAAYADFWLMDAGMTPEQFKRMLHNFVPTLDENLPRIRQTLETGKDPGPEDPEALAARLLGSKTNLPDPIRKLLERIRKRKPEAGPGEGPEVGEV